VKKCLVYAIGIFLITSLACAETLDERFKKIDGLFEKGKYKEALVICQEIARNTPNDERVYGYLGQAYFRTKKYNQAILSFETSLKLKSDYSYSWYYFARTLQAKKQYEKARTKFNEFIKRFPNHKYIPDATFCIANTYYSEKKYPLAIDNYNKVIKGYPKFKGIEYVKFYLAAAYYENKEYKTAIKLLNDFVNEYPKSKILKKAHSLLFALYREEGMVERSIDELKKSDLLVSLGGFVTAILLLIALFTIVVYIFGRIIRKKHIAYSLETSPPIFRIKDVISITLAVLIMPLLLSLVVGKLIYGQYLVGLIASAKSVESVYTITISYILSSILLASWILWLVFKKYLMTKDSIGLVIRDKKSTVTWSLMTILLLTLFSVTYEYIVRRVLHLNIPEDFMILIIQSIKTFGEGIVFFIFIVIIGPIVEEIIFRLYIYNAFKRYTNIKWGLFFSALLFAICHFQPPYLVLLFVVGFVLAYVYEQTKSLVPCIVIHLSNNLLCFIFAYFFPNIKI